MSKRIINGLLYVLLIGALMVGGFVWITLLTGGPWYMTVIFAIMALAAFSLGYSAEGGGSDRNKDENNADQAA
jgi:membrane protein implicated in regulation of membrane protease activity